MIESKIESKIGTKTGTTTFTVELGKVKEFARALGDPHPSYETGECLPPTFGTVIDFWSGDSSLSALLNLNMAKVLHGGQEYEYVGKIRPGDVITTEGEVENAYTKAGMNFFVVRKTYRNQNGETVLLSRSTIIERHGEEESD
ncbi:MaoC family dehydratase N-terminal domain-containing protein [Brevibacillus choshinensis]|uniref:FAS1-like dehydratase domain-containing protein n=1 Tax=Brevibacillus choshinensis TaxID=54911 RepID=UPI000A4DFA34|nr:MaoC family dehydratase N-terminal domain-containing protein [Brevibacillus choshinensis]MED4750925.1 MaoC family dehydratase N-terminal domain-containing protein [Brevibacillus choshinensis]